MTHQIIIQIFCDYYGIEKNVLISKSRDLKIIEKRQLLQKTLRDFNTLERVGEITLVGHDTVLSNIKRISNRIETEPKIRQEYNEIQKIISLYHTTSLFKLIECWSKRMRRLDRNTNPKAKRLHKEMEQRMINLLYWCKKFNIK